MDFFKRHGFRGVANLGRRAAPADRRRGGGGGWRRRRRLAARVRVRAAAAGGLARARGAAYKAPRPAEFWPVTARSRLRFYFARKKKIKRNTKRTPKIPK